MKLKGIKKAIRVANTAKNADRLFLSLDLFTMTVKAIAYAYDPQYSQNFPDPKANEVQFIFPLKEKVTIKEIESSIFCSLKNRLGRTLEPTRTYIQKVLQ